ncbi:MAG: hypothetical protein KGR26_16670, partial [Cyanobacteria bacterium REEB65]|nr:hypothetical protein [Cyanobacteria bacterium REEB65]
GRTHSWIGATMTSTLGGLAKEGRLRVGGAAMDTPNVRRVTGVLYGFVGASDPVQRTVKPSHGNLPF